MIDVAPANIDEFMSGLNVVDQLRTLPKLLNDRTNGVLEPMLADGSNAARTSQISGAMKKIATRARTTYALMAGHRLSGRRDMEAASSGRYRPRRGLFPPIYPFSKGHCAAHVISSTRISLRYIRENRAPIISRTMHMAVP